MVKNIKKGKRKFVKYDPINRLEQYQMYAKIIHNNGGSFNVLCSDGLTRIGKLSNEMKRGPRLLDGSFVVITLREFETEQKHCDIIAHGAPSSDIITMFKRYEPNNSIKTDIEFIMSDDEFKDI